MKETVRNNENYTVSTLKGFFCFLVICIHFGFEGNIGAFVLCFARGAVPFFLVISGYYCYGVNNDVLLKRLKNTIKLLMSTWLCYFIWNLILCLFDNNPVAEIIQKMNALFNPSNFGLAAFYGILNLDGTTICWYLYALLMCYVIWIILKRINLEMNLVVYAFALLGINLYFTQIFPLFCEDALPVYYMRNFLFEAFPLFIIGMNIHKMLDKHVSLKVYSFATLIFGCCMLVFDYMNNRGRELYLSNIIIVVSLVILSMYYPKLKLPIITKIGNRHSTFVFLFHVMVMKTILEICSVMGNSIPKIFWELKPIWILILCVGINEFVLLVKQKISVRKSRDRFAMQ